MIVRSTRRSPVQRYSEYERPEPPPKRHIPTVIDGVTLENPLNDAERVLGEGRGIAPGRRGQLWAGIGAAAGAIPGLGAVTNLMGAGLANRGMSARHNHDGMPLVAPLLGVGAVASLLTTAAAFATGRWDVHLLASAVGAASGAASWGVAGYHGRNF